MCLSQLIKPSSKTTIFAPSGHNHASCIITKGPWLYVGPTFTWCPAPSRANIHGLKCPWMAPSAPATLELGNCLILTWCRLRVRDIWSECVNEGVMEVFWSSARRGGNCGDGHNWKLADCFAPTNACANPLIPIHYGGLPFVTILQNASHTLDNLNWLRS